MDSDLSAKSMAALSDFLVAVLAGIAADQINEAINKRKKREEKQADKPKGKHFSKR